MPEKRRPRWFRFVGYTLFFIAAFIVSIYLTFPMRALKPRVVGLLEQVVAEAGPKAGRYGSPSEVKVEKVSLFRLSGVELKGLSVRLASTDPDPSPTWKLERARVRLQLLPLLLGKRRVGFDVDAYGGNVAGSALIIEQRLAELEVEADGIQLGEIPHLAASLGAPLAVALAAEAQLKMGKTPKETSGEILLQGEGARVGPGTLKVPVPPISLNCNLESVVDLGKLDVKVKVADGKAETERAQLVGKDIDLRADVSVNMRRTLRASPATGALVVKIDEGLLKREKEVKSAVELAELRIKRGKDTEGAYHFKLSGALGSLRPVPDPKAKVD